MYSDSGIARLLRSSLDWRAWRACSVSNIVERGVFFPLECLDSREMKEKRTVLTRFSSFLPRFEVDFARDRPALRCQWV